MDDLLNEVRKCIERYCNRHMITYNKYCHINKLPQGTIQRIMKHKSANPTCRIMQRIFDIEKEDKNN